MKKLSITAFIFLLCAGIIFRLFCGLFVIQPIGAIPSGATLVYWRAGLNLPFICSADGLLKKSGAGVSLLGRGMVLAKVSKPILDRKIMKFEYSETLYLWSTGGERYKK
jgi:hypothetical protein